MIMLRKKLSCVAQVAEKLRHFDALNYYEVFGSFSNHDHQHPQLQVQLEIVESSNPDNVPEKTQAALQSTTAPPAEEVRVHIPVDDPHQQMIINSSSKQKTTALAEEARVETDDDGDDDRDKDFIRRVPTHMREDRSGHLYEPVMVSIGPYHHNKTQYSKMERFKKNVLNKFMEESVAEDATKDKNFYYGKIFQAIDEIRGYYKGVGPDKYTDEAFTELILCDACFLASYMKSRKSMRERIILVLGNMPTVKLVEHDLLRVENQIPLGVVNHVFNLRFGKDEVLEIDRQFISYICYKDWRKLTSLPWKDERFPPLHLLEACQAVLLKREIVSTEPTPKSGEPDQTKFEKHNTPNRSVTYVQAKGIYLRPSSECLQDITFTSYCFLGVLRLPIFFIDMATMVFLQNVVAFELFKEGLNRDGDLASYVNFMNNLIDTSKDVKQLRETGILYSDLGSDEEVLKVFKQINTHGMVNYNVFEDVKRKINEHCQSRSKTWIADLFQSYCRGPWAAIAILAATVVLCLTFLQTYYAIHPKR